MDEKGMFLKEWDREIATTLKVLKAYPAGKENLKPAEKSRTAKELAGVFVTELSGMIGGITKGQIDFANFPKLPASYEEIVAKLENEYPALLEDVRKMSDAEWNSQMDFPVAPKQMGKVRRGDLLWFTLSDMIHHRGQFSVYLRIAGAKVPSIYGPSADEPWM